MERSDAAYDKACVCARAVCAVCMLDACVTWKRHVMAWLLAYVAGHAAHTQYDIVRVVANDGTAVDACSMLVGTDGAS